MKNTLPILFLLLSLLTFSCTKDDEVPVAPKQLRLTEFSTTNPFVMLRNSPITYTPDGLLNKFGFITHSYDNQKRLTSVKYDNTQKLTYDANGRLDTIYLTYSHDTFARDIHTFSYDTEGRCISVKSMKNYKQNNSSHYLLTQLTYDAFGNIVKEEIYSFFDFFDSPHLFETYEYKYDTKKNPMKGMGSPLANIYFYSSFTTNVMSDFNFLSYYSPNNTVEVTYNFYGSDSYPTVIFEYTYNEEGYPIEFSSHSDDVVLGNRVDSYYMKYSLQ